MTIMTMMAVIMTMKMAAAEGGEGGGGVLSLPHNITLDPDEALHGFSYTTVHIVHLQMHHGFGSSFKK